MFKKIKEFFLGKTEESVVELVSAPYKMPEPATQTPIPLVVQHDMGGSYTPESVVEVAPVVVEVAPVVVEVAAPAKAARKPRTPKVVAAPVKAVKEKALAKTKASNVVAMKAPVKAKSKK